MANAVTDTSFEQEVLKATEPVLVDFHAQWCGPCKAMAPALDQVAAELAGKVKIVKVDVDENPKVTGTYGIRAMPTLILFKGGQVAAQHTGAIVQKKKLEEWINASVTA
ncbi:MAG: thioredoxin [Hyphomicrobium sp.]|jgi:thioredoxin 1|nr:MAG: thioredoxin [Hyphomicrobium sp.]